MIDPLHHILNKTLSGDGDSDRHLMTIFSIAISIKAKNIIELGVRGGSTSLPLLMCASINQGHLYSVDIDSTEFVCPNDFKQYYSFHKQDAIEFLESCDKTTPYDLIYVDDWHAYQHVAKELSIIDTMVTPNSIVLVHDLMYATAPNYHSDLTLKDGQWAGGGPYRAVAELNPNFWEFATIPVCNGLTILRKKYTSKYHKC